MDQGIAFLLAMTALVFIIGAIGELVFSRTKLPDVLWLIGAGLIARATGAFDAAALDAVANMFATLVLVVVLFESGTRLVPREVRVEAPRGLLLAVCSFAAKMVFVALISMGARAIGMGLPDDWTFAHGLMLGAMLGGASSLVMSPALRHANIDAKTHSLLDTEARVGEALAVVIALGLAKVIAVGTPGAKATLLMLGVNLFVALAIGVGAGWAWTLVLRLLRESPYSYPVTLSAMVLLYVAIGSVGGSPATGVLAFAIVVGHAPYLLTAMGVKAEEPELQLEEGVRTTHNQFAFVIKCCFFAWIGLRIGPPVALIVLGVFLAFAFGLLRWPIVRALFPKATDQEQRWLTLRTPHGLAAGVLAVLPEQAGLTGLDNLSSIVFSTVMASVVFFSLEYRQAAIATADERPPRPPEDVAIAGEPGRGGEGEAARLPTAGVDAPMGAAPPASGDAAATASAMALHPAEPAPAGPASASQPAPAGASAARPVDEPGPATVRGLAPPAPPPSVKASPAPPPSTDMETPTLRGLLVPPPPSAAQSGAHTTSPDDEHTGSKT